MYQTQLDSWRARVERAPRPFTMPGRSRAASHAITEGGEALAAMLRTENVTELRTRKSDEKDTVEREVAQFMAMITTTATACGVVVPSVVAHIDASPPKVQIIRAIGTMSAINSYLEFTPNGKVPRWIDSGLNEAYHRVERAAVGLRIDIAKEIDTWMQEVYREAWGRQYGSGS